MRRKDGVVPDPMRKLYVMLLKKGWHVRTQKLSGNKPDQYVKLYLTNGRSFCTVSITEVEVFIGVITTPSYNVGQWH